MIQVTCGNCGRKFETDDQYAGAEAQCPACNSAITIPPAPAADDQTYQLEPLPEAAPDQPQAAPAYAAGSVYGAPPTVPGPLVAPVAPTSGIAIAALVLGILSLVTSILCGMGIVFSIVGLILGILSMNQILKSEGRQLGHGLAVTGTVLSGIGLVVSGLFILLMIIGALSSP